MDIVDDFRGYILDGLVVGIELGKKIVEQFLVIHGGGGGRGLG